MRLKHIKLVGFKSFVDSTTVLLPTNLTAIVGPNGCGKSNIIDAVRWVMGGSAKQIRGESLEDVIFTGSATRKPVGHASIELNFDNSDQTLVGPYANYSEIAIRREITRDGQSNYYLNGTRCRRRDITDLFLGTGLGPRSYAIIEQGMISRLIEAKPMDLRNFIEEAAGISKYKERRHETELRINHTQENLARLNDIREELDKQLNHLQRQANAAERYKVLKQEERLLRAQIQGLRLRFLQEQAASQHENSHKQEAELAELMAMQQQLAEDLEQTRDLQTTATEKTNEVQEQFYQVTNDVNRLEQQMQSQQERREQWQQEYNAITQNQELAQQQLTHIAERVAQLQEQVNNAEPQSEQAKTVLEESLQALSKAESELREWQVYWDTFNQQSAQTAKQVEVEQTRIQHLQQRLQANQQRIDRLQGEQRQQELALGSVPMDDFEQRAQQLQTQRNELNQQLEEVLQAITMQRQQNQRLTADLDAAKHRSQTLSGQQTSLETLQQVALGQREEAAMEWLKKYDLVDMPRFAQMLKVEAGWERAVETVLEPYLQAVCVDDPVGFAAKLAELPQANLSLVARAQNDAAANTSADADTLLSKVTAPLFLRSLISGIYVAETLPEAQQLAATLQAHESVITREGVWLSPGWLYVAHKTDHKTGVLQRERELVVLREELSVAAMQIEQCQAAITQGQEQLHDYEDQRDDLQKQIGELVALQAEVKTKQQVQEAHISQVQQRAQQINSEVEDCAQQIRVDQEALENTQQAWQAAQECLQQQTDERESLIDQKNNYQVALEQVRQRAQEDRAKAHQLELDLQAAKLQLDTTEQNKVRLVQQLHDFAEREAFLRQALADSAEPLNELTSKSQEVLTEKSQLEQQLLQARQSSEQVTQQLRTLEQRRQQVDRDLLEKRNELEQARLAVQAHEVRAKGLEEQIIESGYELPELLAQLTEEVNEAEWEENLNQVVRKIERLGAINLAAIDEHVEKSERKEYLDKQYNDLIDALKILEDAMQKMDGETRARFKETYEKINHNFQTLFPALFGGGNASLQLDEEDLLAAGITVMAQPPGKRNSSIHLLSGGEKALTAISLVFAMFQLNPAPFCMLDEVDAPLDDANVSRFCRLVKQMSETVQFIFISHNKLAIEMAEQLAGVTMHEAGVSRMVSVNIEEAIAMATA